MRFIFWYFIIVIFTLKSCGLLDRKATKEAKISIDGKWYRWSKENGYSEFEIDSLYVTVFSEKNGKSKLTYKIENDSFKYLTIGYSAKIIPWGDTMFVLRNGESVSSLFRYNESVNVFESAPDEKDSLLFNRYRESFFKRADLAWAKAGFAKDPGGEKNTIIKAQ